MVQPVFDLSEYQRSDNPSYLSHWDGCVGLSPLLLREQRFIFSIGNLRKLTALQNSPQRRRGRYPYLRAVRKGLPCSERGLLCLALHGLFSSAVYPSICGDLELLPTVSFIFTGRVSGALRVLPGQKLPPECTRAVISIGALQSMVPDQGCPLFLRTT